MPSVPAGATLHSRLDYSAIQNVTFVLNILDYLAEDDRFVAIRKRTRPHKVLRAIEEQTSKTSEEVRKQIAQFNEDAQNEITAAGERSGEELAKIDEREDLSDEAKQSLKDATRIRLDKKMQHDVDLLLRQRNRDIRNAERRLEKEVRAVQDRFKFYALVLPPILPIMLGILVYVHRRQGEREGVSKTRLRFTKEPKEKV